MPPKRNSTDEMKQAIQELLSEVRNNAAIQERLLDRIEQIDERLQRIEEKIDANEQTDIAPLPVAPPSAQRMIPKPKGSISKVQVLKSLQEYIPGKSEDDYKVYLAALDEYALTTIQSYSIQGDNAKKAWKEVDGEDKATLAIQTLNMAVQVHPELEFMRVCVGLWPLMAILQPKWSQKSSYYRKNM